MRSIIVFNILIALIIIVRPAHAQRYTPVGLCAATHNSIYESITLPIGIAAEYPSGSVQSISIVVGDTQEPGYPVTYTGSVENVLIMLDTNNDGIPDTSTSNSCLFDAGVVPVGCTVTQDATLPTVTEDTTFRGRVFLSYGDLTPANSCGYNSYGDHEDFLVVADVQEFITIADVSGPEDDGAITLSATLSHNVRDASGFVSFTVDYLTSDGTATTADNDYTAASGTLTFNGQAGDTQTFTVTPTADMVPEGDQNITVSLQNLSNTTHGIDISDTATITLLEDDFQVELVMSKLVSDNTPNIGSTITFTLQIDNTGPAAAIDAFLVDEVPAGFASITPLTSPVGSSFNVVGNTINWTGIDVPIGGSVSATFSAIVQPP